MRDKGDHRSRMIDVVDERLAIQMCAREIGAGKCANTNVYCVCSCSLGVSRDPGIGSQCKSVGA